MLTRDDLIKENRIEIDSSENVKTLVLRTSSGITGGKPILSIRPPFEYVIHPVVQTIIRPLVLVGPLNHKLNLTIGILYSNNVNTEMILALDYTDLNKTLENILLDFSADSLCAEKSFSIKMLSCVTKDDILDKIILVRYAGGSITAQIESFFKKKLKSLKKLITIYAASEVGQIGLSACPYLSRNHYHPRKGIFVEILNTDENGIGDLVISKNLYTPGQKIKDYKIGDSAVFIKEECPCGDPVTFKLIGRTNFDFIKLVGATLFLEEFERVTQVLNLYLKDYRVFVFEKTTNKRNQGKILMKIIPTTILLEEKNPINFLKQQISKHLFLTPTKTLSELVEQKVFLPLEIEFVDKFTFQHKDAKLRLIQD